jgi:hypothetical protein
VINCSLGVDDLAMTTRRLGLLVATLVACASLGPINAAAEFGAERGGNSDVAAAKELDKWDRREDGRVRDKVAPELEGALGETTACP